MVSLQKSVIGRKVKELPFDHIYNPSVEADTVVLYADIQSNIFKDFHSVLKGLADQGVVRYILRYRPVIGFSPTRPLKDKPLHVAGYGVELMLKRTDYIVIDDRDVESGTSSQSDHGTKHAKVKESDEEIPLITPLHSSELTNLGYQAVQLITTSSSPFDSLQHLSQDFPSQSSRIAAVPINDTLIDILRENNHIIPGGENMFWINGLNIPRDKVEAFNLLGMMRRERSLITSLRQLGLTNEQAITFLTHKSIAESLETTRTNRFDVRDELEGGNVIIWMNDLERDTRYKSWPEGVKNVSPTLNYS
jgi:UDP-glucose:glycoprotein glucosyltransferase